MFRDFNKFGFASCDENQGTGVAPFQAFAATLAERIIPNNAGGFTVAAPSGEAPDFDKDVYIVSLAGYERRFARQPSKTQILSWLNDAAHLIVRNDVYVGGWFDPRRNQFCLDISVPVRGRDRAERIGHVNDQSSIFHPSTETLIWLKSAETERSGEAA